MNSYDKKLKLKDFGIASSTKIENAIVFYDNLLGTCFKYDILTEETELLFEIKSKVRPFIFKIINFEGSLFFFDKTSMAVFEYTNKELREYRLNYEAMFSDFLDIGEKVLMLPYIISSKVALFDLKTKEIIVKETKTGLDAIEDKEIIFPFLVNEKVVMPVLGTNVLYEMDIKDFSISERRIDDHSKICSCCYDKEGNNIVVTQVGSTDIRFYNYDTLKPNKTIKGENVEGRYYSRLYAVDDEIVCLPGQSSSELTIVNCKSLDISKITIDKYISKIQLKKNMMKSLSMLSLDKERYMIFPFHILSMLELNLSSRELVEKGIYIDKSIIWSEEANGTYSEGDIRTLDRFIDSL